MKFVRFRTESGRASWGWIDRTDSAAVREPLGVMASDGLQNLLAEDPDRIDRLCAEADTHEHSTEALHLLAPVAMPSKIIAVGRNYAEHASELGNVVPEAPMLFGILPSAITGPFDDIHLPPHSDQIDWEGELGVVIGRTARSVASADALAVIAGYVVVNDISARDLQRKDQQWTRAKSFDSFKPTGPCLVTADELGLARDLRLSVTVNGVQKQNSTTALMVHKVDELIEYVSSFCTLNPGDIIATGTPSGVGSAANPQTFLKAGDVVETEIEGIGHMLNRIVAGAARDKGAEELNVA